MRADFYEILVLKVHNVVFYVTILSILVGGYQCTLSKQPREQNVHTFIHSTVRLTKVP